MDESKFSARTRRALTLAAAGVVVAGAGVAAWAGPVYLSRWSSVSATVGFGDAPPDAEKRGSTSLKPVKLSATAGQDLGTDEPAGDFIGGDATVHQSSELTDGGIVSHAWGEVFAGGGDNPYAGSIEAVARGSAVGRTKFVLDAPHAFTFFPLGTPDRPAMTGYGGYAPESGGSATLRGKDVNVSVDLAGANGRLDDDLMPVTGELPAGTYTFGHELNFAALDGSVEFDLASALLLDPIVVESARFEASSVVVPLPAAAWAGAATLAGLGVLREVRRRRA